MQWVNDILISGTFVRCHIVSLVWLFLLSIIQCKYVFGQFFQVAYMFNFRGYSSANGSGRQTVAKIWDLEIVSWAVVSSFLCVNLCSSADYICRSMPAQVSNKMLKRLSLQNLPIAVPSWVIWLHGKDPVEEFLKHLNTLNSKIQFTMVMEYNVITMWQMLPNPYLYLHGYWLEANIICGHLNCDFSLISWRSK